MDYKTELQNNNSDLRSVLETVRALPEAGGAVQTARVNISTDVKGSFCVHFFDGVEKCTDNIDDSYAAVIDVAIGSCIVITTGPKSPGGIALNYVASILEGNMELGKEAWLSYEVESEVVVWVHSPGTIEIVEK